MSKKVIYFNDDEILKGGKNPKLELPSRTTVQQSESPNNCDNNQGFNLKNSKVVNTVLGKKLGSQDAVGVLSDTPPPGPRAIKSSRESSSPLRQISQDQYKNNSNNSRLELSNENPSNENLQRDDLSEVTSVTYNSPGSINNLQSTKSTKSTTSTTSTTSTIESLSSAVVQTQIQPPLLKGGASESTQLNQLVEQLLATNMAKISNQLTSQSGGGLNITDVLSGINEQLSNLNTNIGKIIQLNNKNI